MMRNVSGCAGLREAAAGRVEDAMASAHLLRGAAWRRTGAPSLAEAAALTHLAARPTGVGVCWLMM